jgi:repressor LexA
MIPYKCMVSIQDQPPLSSAQRKVLDLIQRFIARNRMPPTRAELAHFRKCNRATVQQHLRALEAKGYLKLTGEYRGIQLIRDMADAPFEDLLPLVGRVAAGPPLLATTDIDDYYRVDTRLFRPKAQYLRRIAGDSMKDMGIQDGDWVGVRATTSADNGQIVVAKLFPPSGPEITIKMLQRSGPTVSLLSRNPNYVPIVIDLRREQFEIEGIYCGHIHPAKSR